MGKDKDYEWTSRVGIAVADSARHYNANRITLIKLFVLFYILILASLITFSARYL